MSELQANQPINFSSFAEWCKHKDSLSEAARHTVEVLLEQSGTSDANEAEEILLKLTELNLTRNEITDITPLSALTNLTQLYFCHNEITDITPLSALTNLTQLDFIHNEITDITPLSALTKLTQLYFIDNEITDITPLSALTNLTQLYIENNKITDITPLSALTNLTYLDLRNNLITDITGLSALTNLNTLHLYCNQITDTAGLSALTNLNTLHLYCNQITDTAGLSALTNLNTLHLYCNQITDITGLSALTNLTELNLESNQITDITGLSALTNLTELNLCNNQITDTTGLSALTNLTELNLCNNQITDITGLSALTNLNTLHLCSNQITDTTGLSALTNLTQLYFRHNQITDISPLSALTNLNTLYLESNQIIGITGLSALTNLTYVELSNNQIIDITPLLGLTNLNVLSLYNNPITDLNLSIELTQKYLTLSTAPIDSEKTTELVRKIYTTIGREAPRIIVCSSPQIAYLNFIEPLKIDCISQIATGNLGWGKSLLPTFRTLGCHNRFDRKFEQKLSDFLYKVQRNLFDDRQSKILKCLKFVVWLLGGAEDGLLKELFQSVDVGLSRVLWKVLCDEIRLEPNADRILVSEFEELLEDYPESLEYEFRSDSNYLKPLTSRDMVKEIHLTEFLIAKFGMTLDLRSQELFRCKQQLFEECGWIFPFEKICLICDRPLHIRFDRENRLHAEGESAIAFADGYSLYFHHGVKLPEQYGKVHPDLWQAEWLLSEENAELRRLLIQRIGYDRICQQLQAVELDSWQEYTLLKIDNADVEPIYLLKMTCPSTGHIHALRVPPALESAKDAISWVNWDIEPEQFSVQT